MRERMSFFEDKKSKVDSGCESFRNGATNLIDSQNLVNKLGLDTEREKEYLVASLSWNWCRKSYLEMDYLQNSIPFQRLENMGGLLTRITNFARSMVNLGEKIEEDLFNKKNELLEKDSSISSIANIIDRATNIVSTVECLDKKNRGSETDFNMDELMKQFHEEILIVRTRKEVLRDRDLKII